MVFRFVHSRAGKCYLLLQSRSTEKMYPNEESTTDDSPPAYSAATADEIVTDAAFIRNSLREADGNLLAPGFYPSLGRKKVEKGTFRNLGVIDLPFNLMIAKKSLISTMSALYATMLIVACLVFVSTEVITINVPVDYFELKGFYTYLYSGSIIFMCYIFFYVLRVKVNGKEFDNNQQEIDHFIKQMAKATGIELKEAEGKPGDCRMVRRLTVFQNNSTNPAGGSAAEEENQTEMLVKLMTSESEKSHGSLMLRCGAIAFGLGTLIYTGLELVHFFEIPFGCNSWHILSGVNPVLHMIFTFMQMYYLFMHSRLNINKNKVIAKFGLMHLIATNCCIWIRTLVKESVTEITESEEFDNLVSEETKKRFLCQNSNLTDTDGMNCKKVDILGDTIKNSSVYLFPFIIEFSMIGAHIIYNMWKNVGNHPTFAMVGENETKKEKVYHRLDWSGSDVGLFIGLLALVTLTITLILYFSLVNQEQYHLIAVLIINITDTAINIFMCIAIIIGFFQVRNLRFVQAENEHDVLLIIGASGIFLYASYTIIAGYLSHDAFEPTSLVIINGIVELVQVNLQLLFIADLKQKNVAEEHGQTKPGRQIVTFLILSNLGLWITYNFEIQKVNATPDQLQFYGFFPWIIIQRITLPLCVFFRFHSTVVFAELWKNCYVARRGNKSTSL